MSWNDYVYSLVSSHDYIDATDICYKEGRYLTSVKQSTNADILNTCQVYKHHARFKYLI